MVNLTIYVEDPVELSVNTKVSNTRGRVSCVRDVVIKAIPLVAVDAVR